MIEIWDWCMRRKLITISFLMLFWLSSVIGFHFFEVYAQQIAEIGVPTLGETALEAESTAETLEGMQEEAQAKSVEEAQEETQMEASQEVAQESMPIKDISKSVASQRAAGKDLGIGEATDILGDFQPIEIDEKDSENDSRKDDQIAQATDSQNRFWPGYKIVALATLVGSLSTLITHYLALRFVR